MAVIDLAFEIRGTTIPIDYGYALFSTLSRVVPQLHGDRRVGVHPIRGMHLSPRELTLVPQSRIRLRMPSELIGGYLELGGKTLDLEGARVEVGMPRSEPLRPCPALKARLVTIGRITEPTTFEASLRRQLTELGVTATPSFLPSTDPLGREGPSRRILRIKQRKIIGYPITIAGLTAEESLIVQEHGLGSRRRMGCGVFVRHGGK